MAPARLIIRKLPRGEYEIGTHTEDGAIVARVGVWDGRSIDQRGEAFGSGLDDFPGDHVTVDDDAAALTERGGHR